MTRLGRGKGMETTVSKTPPLLSLIYTSLLFHRLVDRRQSGSIHASAQMEEREESETSGTERQTRWSCEDGFGCNIRSALRAKGLMSFVNQNSSDLASWRPFLERQRKDQPGFGTGSCKLCFLRVVSNQRLINSLRKRGSDELESTQLAAMGKLYIESW